MTSPFRLVYFHLEKRDYKQVLPCTYVQGRYSYNFEFFVQAVAGLIQSFSFRSKKVRAKGAITKHQNTN